MSLVFESLFLNQTAKILSRISLKYFGDASFFQFGMQLPTWVQNGHIAAGWVGECCSKLGTPTTIPKSDTKECLLGYSKNAARCKWGKVAVMVWTGCGSNSRGWGGLMLWSSQR